MLKKCRKTGKIRQKYRQIGEHFEKLKKTLKNVVKPSKI